MYKQTYCTCTYTSKHALTTYTYMYKQTYCTCTYTSKHTLTTYMYMYLQVTSIRLALSKILEGEEKWRASAEVLCGIPLESGQK